MKALPVVPLDYFAPATIAKSEEPEHTQMSAQGLYRTCS